MAEADAENCRESDESLVLAVMAVCREKTR